MGFPVSSNIPVTILDEQGQAVPHRNNVKIVGAELTDSAVNDETTITVDTNPDKGWYLEDVKDFDVATVTNVASATITWEDPDDIVSGGVTQADWAGTKIVRKEGSIPQSASDGVVVVDSKVKDQYKIVGYVDSSISLEHTYYYRAFPYTERGQVTSGSYKEVYIERVYIYGAEWDGTAISAWTRTDDASDFIDPIPQMKSGSSWTTGSSPFDLISPWKDIERVEDASAGTLVKIPKFYYKWTRDGAKMKLQISSTPVNGFFTSPAHADRGDGEGERDYIYIGAYPCVESTHKSTSGALPQVSETMAQFRSAIHSLGSEFWSWDYALYWTICMLYLVEYADWNSQSKIGHGCSDSGAMQNTGLTDGMTYHTGTNATSTSSYGHVRYRYIEDLWANALNFVEGIYFDGSSVYCINKPQDFGDTSKGTFVGTKAPNANTTKEWFESNVSGMEYAIFTSKVVADATFSSYVCDHCYIVQDPSRSKFLAIGAPKSQSKDKGLFFLYQYIIESTSDNEITGRLMKLPNS